MNNTDPDGNKQRRGNKAGIFNFSFFLSSQLFSECILVHQCYSTQLLSRGQVILAFESIFHPGKILKNAKTWAERFPKNDIS